LRVARGPCFQRTGVFATFQTMFVGLWPHLDGLLGALLS